jgi:flagella basal body P-ring formation protein FlgA
MKVPLIFIATFGISTLLGLGNSAHAIENSVMLKEAIAVLTNQLAMDYDGEVQVSNFGGDTHNARECHSEVNYSIQDYKNLSSRVVVQASCALPQWNIYFPLKAEILKKVVLTNRSLSKGSILAQSDLSLQKRNILPLSHGYYENVNDVVGLETNTAMRTGSLLKPESVTAPILINRGDLVTIKAQVPGIVISMHGVAQNNGALGDLVKVKNSSSNKIVEGKVISRGAIQILM